MMAARPRRSPIDWRWYERPPLSGLYREIADIIDRGQLGRAEDRLRALESAEHEASDPVSQSWLRAELGIRCGRIDAALTDWAPVPPAPNR